MERKERDRYILNSSEIEAVEKLKTRLESVIESKTNYDETMFIRFLRARDFQMDKAEDMLRRHLLWRKANGIDTILEDYTPNEIAVKYLPLSRIGFDKCGSPIRYLDFGNADFKGIIKSCKANEIIKTVLTFFEDDIRCMKEKSKIGKPVHEWLYILNFEGYSFVKATHKQTLEFLMNIFHAYEENYPERLKAAIVINSSIYFTMLYSVVKPFLSQATVRKVSIYGKDGWKSELLKSIDSEVLPGFLGGKKIDPDGNIMCNSVVKHGEDVPEDLYMTSKTRIRVNSQPGARKLVVSRKSKTCLPIEVKYPDSLLEWEFETECRDISFAVHFNDDNGNIHNLVPKQRIDAHLAAETGMYKCEKPGTYILVFDNSYSWIHRKEIYCKASVITPDGQKEVC